jgi:CBS domain-containing protein
MLSTKPITSTLPITISENATIDEVAALLRAHREEIEEFSKSPRRRRELAVTRNIGLQALTWLQQLEGLDEQHVLPKQPCLDLGWLLVAEGNEQAMISWLVEESSRVRSSQDWVKPSRANYHDVGAIGNRTRR